MSAPLEQIVKSQRAALTRMLATPMQELAQKMAPAMDDRASLEQLLQNTCTSMSYSKYLYVMDDTGVQCTSNIQQDKVDTSRFGRDRSNRPYMSGMHENLDFWLSDAYISQIRKHPSLTAVHAIRDASGKAVGYLGIDFDLRELPHPTELYKESSEWRQIKGDPAIRSSLFLQKRTQSVMDDHIDDVFALLDELIQQHGVFHGKLHFSSSRATVWLADDPFNYRLLNIEELTDPDICLAFPRRPWFDKATIEPAAIAQVFERFRELRFGDDTLYLRAGSLNIVNGLVGLNFSCDGSHYMHYAEFLSRGLEFWFGDAACVNTSSDDLAIHHYLELIGQEGCEYVRTVIEQMDNKEQLPVLDELDDVQQTELLDELKSIMAVYDKQ